MIDISKVIMIVDDDKTLSSMLCEYLEQEGYTTACLYDGQQAVDHIVNDEQYGVIVLDIMMPNLNGLEALQILRRKINTPIIMLTGRGDDIDRIIGLEMGADDYLGKPCNPRELVARIRAVIRRTRNLSKLPAIMPEKIHSNGICLNVVRRQVVVNGEQLELTGAEFNVLMMLMSQAGNIISKQELTRKVLHREITVYDRSIDVHVSRLRKKLQSIDPDYETSIKTVRGQGYLFIK